MAQPTTQLDRDRRSWSTGHAASATSSAGCASSPTIGTHWSTSHWACCSSTALQEQRPEKPAGAALRAQETMMHLGEVSIAWLDADLQARLGRRQCSGVHSPGTGRHGSENPRAFGQVGRLQTIVATSQKVLDDSQVKDTTALRPVSISTGASRDRGHEDLVSTLAGDVGSIPHQRRTVLELRRSLQDPAGNRSHRADSATTSPT